MLGRRTQLQYPNGMTVAYAYDARGRLTDIHCRDAANVTLERYTYTFDGADNITQVADAATAKWAYAYDDRYRLTQAERYLGAALKHRYTYTYDGADNAATQAVYNASAGTTNSIAYTYNAGNELTQAVSSANGTTSYAYDLWGRLTGITRGSQSAALGWAYQDRLKSYTTTLTGERSVNFAYTGDGRRMGVDNTLFGAKSWSYDGAWGVRTQSYASLPDSSRWYIQEPWGAVLAEAPVSGVVSDLRYYVRDHLGSTRSVRREDTTKFAWLEYDPYGTTYASGGWTGFVQDRFTGHEFDMETNMYWAPYRYYRPDMLRWASRDPMGMADGPNVYGYVNGMTTQQTDSLGLWHDDVHGPYSGEDYGPTGPTKQCWRHFRNMKDVLPELIDSIISCDYSTFKSRMHQGQDSFAHYSQGYRCLTGGHVPQDIRNWWRGESYKGTDNSLYWREAFKKTMDWTRYWERAWNANCECK